MSVTIKPVRSKRDFKTFARFANKLYKGNKYYVPSMPFDDLNTFDKEKNGAFEFSEAEFYLAYKDGKPVGRVAAIVNHKANESWKVKQVRFGWIDFIDDIEVSAALLDAVSEFGRARGMDQIVGPLGFTDFDPEGMLVEGFDRLSTMALIYNHPYYPEHLKKLGYVKETGWVEYRITIPEQLPERHIRLADLVKERYNLIIEGLGLDLSLEKEFELLKLSFIGRAGRDYAASRGEYLNGLILAKYLGFSFVDAENVIFFRDDGT
ncbi:MAG: hypothetical protein II194_07300, partial [Bacteroidales bacterium]|nr:hypothetical protein [Bacteroidales bacterium]